MYTYMYLIGSSILDFVVEYKTAFTLDIVYVVRLQLPIHILEYN